MRAVRDDLMDAWARFAATGDPGWPLYDPYPHPNTPPVRWHDLTDPKVKNV